MREQAMMAGFWLLLICLICGFYLVTLAIWLASYACPAVANLVKYYRRRQRRGKGLCLACGYNLTGNTSGICPECGEPLRGAGRATP
jgi:uncharacterized paraquat-inducible protein A